MKFLLDQSADARLVAWLTKRGHDAIRIGRDHPPGLPDEEVLAIGRRESRILITDDRDFGELVFRHRQPHSGVIYLRLASYSFALTTARLEDVLTNYADRLDQFLVVTPGSVRVTAEVIYRYIRGPKRVAPLMASLAASAASHPHQIALKALRMAA